MKNDAPIKKRKLSDEVLDRLLSLFESGEIRPNDTMPSERELMERFQVGRPAVREALQSLERLGLIMIRHGERAKVLEPTGDGIFDQIDVSARQLFANSVENVEYLKEARQLLEVGITKLAVERSIPAEVRTLEKHLNSMRENKNNRTEFLKFDQEFHLTLAKMSRNPILLATLRAVFKWLSRHYAELLGVNGLEDLTLEEHEAIYESLVSKDADAAAKHVSDHILRVNDLYPKPLLKEKP
jgi:DNA-binding FadR family transcriptional regulator